MKNGGEENNIALFIIITRKKKHIANIISYRKSK